MQRPAARNIPRRTLFGAAGVTALLALAGCNPFTGQRATITVTEEAPPPAAPLVSMIFKVRLHVLHLTQAIAADTRDAKKLTMLLHDRQAHLAALVAENKRLGGTPAPTAATTASAAPIPTNPDEIIALIRGDAAEAQSTFTDALVSAEPLEAELFASIAACLATHRTVLA